VITAIFRRNEMKRRFFIFVLIFSVFALAACSSKDENNDSTNDGDNTGDGPKCGNGIIEEGEVCDGNVPCWQAGHFYPEFEAVCSSDCSGYDTGKCQARPDDDLCGNFVKDDKETCEQGETKPCTELPGNYVTGDAGCNRWCTGWETTNCSAGGTKTCAQLFNCVDACADDACIEKCKGEGSAQGLELYEDLYECWNSSCASGADKTECMKEN
jgi:hypothetical protein